ncbi:MAG: hypothetical protein QUS09_02125, partial [Methanotrichaceae archaeon]|nr:hypothetical protein [Methanotrichaceae archaeon]
MGELRLLPIPLISCIVFVILALSSGSFGVSSGEPSEDLVAIVVDLPSKVVHDVRVVGLLP